VNDNILHIYGQTREHDRVFIVGDRTGLRELQEAIQHALDYPDAGLGYAMTNDGEYFSVTTILMDDDWQSENWQQMGVPYSDDSFMYAAEQREDAIWPRDLIHNGEGWRTLMERENAIRARRNRGRSGG